MIIAFIFYAITFGLVCYLFGCIIASFFSTTYKNLNKVFFIKIVIGLLSLTVIYASIKANLNSILSGLVMLSICYLIVVRKTINFNSSQLKFEIKQFVLYIFATIVFVSFAYFIIFPNSYNVHPDYLFYGALGDYLKLYGKENLFLSISPDLSKNELYHYSNEWCVALISNFSNLNGTEAFLYIFLPTTFSILYIGIVYLTELITKSKSFYTYLIAALFFVISSMSLGESLPSILNIGDFNILYAPFFGSPSSPKMILTTMLILLALFTYDEKKIHQTIFIFCSICILWPTTLLAILGGVSIYVLFTYFKENKKSEFQANLLYLLITSIFIISFFAFQSQPYNFKPENDVSYLQKFLSFYKSDFSFKELFIILIKTIGSRIYYYVILLIIIIFNFKTILKFYEENRRFNSFMLMFLFILMSALFFRTILYFLTDSNQIFANIIDNSTAKILFFSIVVITIKSNVTRLSIFLLIIFTTITTYRQFEETTSKSLPPAFISQYRETFAGDNIKFAIILKREKSNFKHISQVVYPPMIELRAFSSSYFPVNLNIIERIKLFDNSVSEKHRYNSLLYNSSYYQYLSLSNEFDDTFENKKRFLREMDINFLIVEKDALTYDQLNTLSNLTIIPCHNKLLNIYKL